MTLDEVLDSKGSLEGNVIGFTLIFFDGEEAFNFFSTTDGLYGSNHLADLWEKTTYTPPEATNLHMENELDRIILFVLLDLIGATKPTIMSTSVRFLLITKPNISFLINLMPRQLHAKFQNHKIFCDLFEIS